MDLEMHERNKKCIQGLGWNTSRKVNVQGDLDINGRAEKQYSPTCH